MEEVVLLLNEAQAAELAEGVYPESNLIDFNVKPDVRTQYGVKDMIELIFGVRHEGKIFTVKKRVTRTISSGTNYTPPSSLYCVAMALLDGAPFPAKLVLSELVGKPCQVLIKNRTDSKGRVWSNVAEVLRPQRKPTGPLLRQT